VSTERECKIKISAGLGKSRKQAASGIDEPFDDNDALSPYGSAHHHDEL